MISFYDVFGWLPDRLQTTILLRAVPYIKTAKQYNVVWNLADSTWEPELVWDLMHQSCFYKYWHYGAEGFMGARNAGLVNEIVSWKK